MKNLRISESVLRKLSERHNVTRTEVEQCFQNRYGRLLTDDRVTNRTHPPTLWFIAETNGARRLKIVYIQTGNSVQLKSAYEPNDDETRIYRRHG